MHRFPFKHIVVEDTKEVLVVCSNSASTAMGIGAMTKKYYPGYTTKIIPESYWNAKAHE